MVNFGRRLGVFTKSADTWIVVNHFHSPECKHHMLGYTYVVWLQWDTMKSVMLNHINLVLGI